MANKIYSYRSFVRAVEQKFVPVYDVNKVGDAKTEGQMAPEKISAGWWIVLPHGLTFRVSDEKPDIKPGYIVSIMIGVAPPDGVPSDDAPAPAAEADNLA